MDILFLPFLTVAVLKLAAYTILLTAFVGPSGSVAGFWGALLPVLGGAVSKFLSKKGEDKKAAAAEEQRLAQQEEDDRAAWDAKYASPQAEASRMSASMRLGRLLAATGGREKAPPSLVSSLDTLRSTPEYKSRTNVPLKKAGGGWDLASQLVTGAGQLAKGYAADKAYKQQKAKDAYAAETDPTFWG